MRFDATNPATYRNPDMTRMYELNIELSRADRISSGVRLRDAGGRQIREEQAATVERLLGELQPIVDRVKAKHGFNPTLAVLEASARVGQKEARAWLRERGYLKRAK